jgi:Lysylphosphatidylglycerol synthase TM region
MRSASPLPRSVAWTVLIACALATLAVGLVTTAVILGGVPPRASGIPLSFWVALAFGAAATCVSFGLRTVRWTFLLRRTDVRIPIRDACIGYMSGLCMLLVPLFIGEIVVRAAIQRSRARVPLVTTAIVNLWERLIDIAALALIAGLGGLLVAGPRAAAWIPLLIVTLTAVGPIRRTLLATALTVVNGTTPCPTAISEQRFKRYTW